MVLGLWSASVEADLSVRGSVCGWPAVLACLKQMKTEISLLRVFQRVAVGL